MHKQPPKHGVSSCFGLNISLRVVLVNPYDLPVGLALSSPLWRGACSSEKESDVLSVAELGGGQSQDRRLPPHTGLSEPPLALPYQVHVHTALRGATGLLCLGDHLP